MTSLDTGFSAYYSAVFGWLVKKDQGPRRGRRGGFLVFWCFRFLVEIQKPGQGPRRGRRGGFLVFWCFRFLVEIHKPGQGPRRGRRGGFLVFWCFRFLVEIQKPGQGPRLGRRGGFLVFWCFRFLVEIQKPGQRPRLRLRKAGCLVFWSVGVFVKHRNIPGTSLRSSVFLARQVPTGCSRLRFSDLPLRPLWRGRRRVVMAAFPFRLFCRGCLRVFRCSA